MGRLKKETKKRSLPPKQAQFVKEYLIDLNATQAAIRAKYSPKTASRIGPELLGKTWVAEAIQKEMDKRAKRTEITADRVLQELAKIGFANISDFVTLQGSGVPALDFSRADDAKLAAVSEITQDTYTEGRGDDAVTVKKTKFKLHDKVKALQHLGNHLGLFRENPGGEDCPMPVKIEIAVVDGRKE